MNRIYSKAYITDKNTAERPIREVMETISNCEIRNAS